MYYRSMKNWYLNFASVIITILAKFNATFFVLEPKVLVGLAKILVLGAHKRLYKSTIVKLNRRLVKILYQLISSTDALN